MLVKFPARGRRGRNSPFARELCSHLSWESVLGLILLRVLLAPILVLLHRTLFD